MRLFRTFSPVVASALLAAPILAQENQATPTPTALQAAVSSWLAEQQSGYADWAQYEALVAPPARMVDDRREDGALVLVFNDRTAWRAFSPEEAAAFRQGLRQALGRELADGEELRVHIQMEDVRGGREVPLEELITSPDLVRQRAQAGEGKRQSLEHPVVRNASYPGPDITSGLAGKHLIASPSHGWTWHKENRWQLQRARVFTIVEDLHPLAYMNPFLIPMLENAGAVVFSTRERDWQTREVIVDNDGELLPGSEMTLQGTWSTNDKSGWHGPRPAALGPLEEPFTKGSTMRAQAGTDAQAVFTPYIPRQGAYAVYISWAHGEENATQVPVTVRHRGGETTFHVNQQVGGGTWICLGVFSFEQGTDAERGAVVVDARGAIPKGSNVTIDAARFGGGMGNIAPADMVSYKPRYAEAARYWLQYAGAPAEEVFYLNVSEGHFGEDYNRDITARGELPNWMGAPADGPTPEKAASGLGIPIDAMISWHTDAGHDEDGMIGLLGIYSLTDDENRTVFPDGRDRMLNRDLTWLVMDEIMRTMRDQYTSTYPLRHLHNRQLGETRRPEVPALLLETVSHHNFNDMKYSLDPRVRFDQSRAVYKGVLRFLAMAEGSDPVIQPLPPTHVTAVHEGDGTVRLAWRPQADPLEPTATADAYIVYRSADGEAFDNGTLVGGETTTTLEGLDPDTSHYFRIAAANSGGVSFPSRTVGVRFSEGQQPVLIVDGFDRVSGPAIIHKDEVRGFARNIDPGVGYEYNYAMVGDQYDFDPNSEWKNDLESPGRGGTQSHWEDFLEPGNTFNYIAAHGEALAAAGYVFDSALSEAYAAGLDEKYWLIDWIAGEQRTVMPYRGNVSEGDPDRMQPEFQVLTAEARSALALHLRGGGRLLISGAYIGDDLIAGPLADQRSRDFARNSLGIIGYSANATEINYVVPSRRVWDREQVPPFRFGRDLENAINILPTVYNVEHPEGYDLAPGTTPLLFYGDSARIAGFQKDGVAVFGFPLETVMPPEARVALMEQTVERLKPPHLK